MKLNSWKEMLAKKTLSSKKTSLNLSVQKVIVKGRE